LLSHITLTLTPLIKKPVAILFLLVFNPNWFNKSNNNILKLLKIILFIPLTSHQAQ